MSKEFVTAKETNQKLVGALIDQIRIFYGKSSLVMFDHEAKGQNRPRQDLSRIFTSIPEEVAEELWEEINRIGLKIKGIDKRPKTRGSKSKKGPAGSNQEDYSLNGDQFLPIKNLIERTSGHFELLTQREEINLTIKRRRGLRPGGNFREGKESENELVDRNYRLILSIAQKYLGLGLDLEDLFQEASIGFQRGVKKFDWRKGYKLATYCTWWTKQGVTRSLSLTSAEIRYPEHFRDKMRKLAKATDFLKNKLGIENPPDSDIAELMEITIEEVQDIKKNTRILEFLDGFIDKNGETTLGEMVANPDPGPEEIFDGSDEEREAAELINKLLERLAPQERNVIESLYLSPEEKVTRVDVGRKMDRTRERIRQVEAKAMEKMRKTGKKIMREKRFVEKVKENARAKRYKTK